MSTRRAGILLCLMLSAVQALRFPKPTFGLNIGTGALVDISSDSSRQRRPPYAYSATLDGTLSWWQLSVGMNLRYNSDDRFTAQRVNQFNLSPSWRWGRVYLGDYSASMSEYTCSGMPLYGAGIELFPGTFRLTAIAGRSRRASGDTTEWSYNRNLVGLRLGAEQFAVNVVKVLDDTTSNSMGESIPRAPEENLVLGVSSKVRLAQCLSVETELAGSVHTRDLRSREVDIEEIPDFVYKVYNPRLSTRMDYAGRGLIRYSPRFMSIDLSLAQVGPGFTSLGTSYLKNDYRFARLGVSTRSIPKTAVSAAFERGYDNIVGDRLATTQTDNLSGSMNTSPLAGFALAANYTWRRQVKDAPSDSFSVNTLTQVASISPNVNLRFGHLGQNVSLVGAYQDFQNLAPFTSTPASRVMTVALNYSTSLWQTVTLGLSYSRTINLIDTVHQSPESFIGSSLSASRAFLNGKLQNSLTLSYQPSTLGTNLMANGTHNLSPTSRDAINLSWNVCYFKCSSPGGCDNSTQRVSLSYSRRIF